MKKLSVTIAIVLGMTIGLSAQEFQESQEIQQGQQSVLSQHPLHGGLFERGVESYEVCSNYGSGNYEFFANLRNSLFPVLPNHGATENQEATPLGSGIAVLLGLGAAYAVAKKRKED